MRYVLARIEDAAMEKAYRVYITDSIYHYTDGHRLTVRWLDSLKKPEAEKAAQEIVDETFLHAGLTLKERP